jgi:Holliday junction resolvase
MTEQQIQKKIIDKLQDNGAYVIKIITASKSGVPDIVACYKGIFLGIEVKRLKTRDNVSKLQQYNLTKIEKCGGFSTVAWELSHIEQLLVDVDTALEEKTV